MENKDDTFCLTGSLDDFDVDEIFKEVPKENTPTNEQTQTAPHIQYATTKKEEPKIEGHINYVECDAQKHYKHLGVFRELLDYIDGYVAGGCFKNIFAREMPRDIDVYFETQQQFNNALQLVTTNTSFEKYYSNDNVEAFFYTYKGNKYVVELVKKFFCTPKELLDKFDFSICKFAVYMKKVKIENRPNNEALDETWTLYEMYDPDFFEHLYLKKLVTDDNIVLPANTFTRMIKYIRYGYLPCMETKKKIVEGLRGTRDELNNTSFYDGMD